MMEIWAPVPGWEGRYEVSTIGRVRSKDMIVGGRCGSTAVRRGRVLLPAAKRGKYLAVTLAEGERREQHSVHELVLSAFVIPCPPGMQARHLNDDKNDNALSNLAWGTAQENADDCIANGNRPRGEAHHQRKLTEEAVRDIRTGDADADALARRYGVHSGTIHAVRARKTWRHI